MIAIVSRRPLRSQGGQVLPIAVGGMFAIIGLVALVVDGGNLWAQQRIVQNGADAVAQSGAIVMAQRLAGATEPTPAGWDGTIAARLASTATANDVSVDAAYYTDICGIPLKSDGTAALNGDVEDLSAAARVGNGFPSSSAVTPDCPSLTVGPPAGVLVLTTRHVETYFGRAVGFATADVSERATAVAGYLQGTCDASQGIPCRVLPVTVPVNAVTCDGRNNMVNSGVPWSRYVVYKFPLCSSEPGNVGWLDWDPPGGGTPETVCSIVNPDSPAMNLPTWAFVTETGNANGGGGSCSMSIQDALRLYNGKVVLIPQFDVICGVEPNHSQVAVPNNFGCPADELDGGNGQNLWYRFPSFAFLQLCDPSIPECNGLQGAYIQGSNAAECDSGNGATSCLVGRFVDVLASGTVGAGVGGGTSSNKVIGTQLIR